MKQALEVISEKLCTICKLLAAILLGILAVLIFAGVIARYVFNNPFVWLYEVTLILFSWMVFLGISVAVKNGENVTLNLIGTMPAKLELAFAVLANVCTVLFFFFLTKEGIVIIGSTSSETYNTIDISTAWFYVPVAVCGVISLVHMVSAYVGKRNPLHRLQTAAGEV